MAHELTLIPTSHATPVAASGLSPILAPRHARVDRNAMTDPSRGYIALNKQANRLIDAFKKDGRLDAPTAHRMTRILTEAFERNQSAMSWLVRIKQQDQYTAEHCINVATLSMGLARALAWSKADIELAGVAGLLHDLGKMKLDMAILNKAGKLTPEEFEHVKSHSLLGYRLLKNDPAVPGEVMQAVRDHHERPDGRGYPFGKSACEIGPLTALVAVVDAYDAITSHRVYDAARTHQEALDILWTQRGTQFDTGIVEAFIQFMGWGTPGTLQRIDATPPPFRRKDR